MERGHDRRSQSVSHANRQIMKGVVVDDIERARSQFGHQPKIGMVFAEESNIVSLVNASFEE